MPRVFGAARGDVGLLAIAASDDRGPSGPGVARRACAFHLMEARWLTGRHLTPPTVGDFKPTVEPRSRSPERSPLGGAVQATGPTGPAAAAHRRALVGRGPRAGLSTCALRSRGEPSDRRSWESLSRESPSLHQHHASGSAGHRPGVDDPAVPAVAAPQVVVLMARRRAARARVHVREPAAVGRERRRGQRLKTRQVVWRQRALGHRISACAGVIERDRTLAIARGARALAALSPGALCRRPLGGRTARHRGHRSR